jgi:outer membrane protein
VPQEQTASREGWRVSKQSGVWQNLRSGACVALGLLGLVGQTPFAMAQTTPQTGSTTPAAGQAQTPQVPTTSPQGVSPTAPAAPQAVQNDTTGIPGLPQAPAPVLTQPLFMRPTATDYAKPNPFWPDPLAIYTPKNYPQTRLGNAPRLGDLLREGKIYLSLADAVTLTLENNYDIAIARVNLDIADTDLLRAKAGAVLRGVSTGLITNTLGGSTSTITGGGGPGGTNFTTAASTGANGLVLSTNGSGPLPEPFDPVLTGTLQYERSTTPQTVTFLTGTNSLQTNTAGYNFGYQQGFSPGTLLSVTFNNSRQTSNSIENSYNPALGSSFRAEATQHLLQGFGTWINKRFIVQAKNDRRIADSAFRQQVIYTVSQVESIYWALVNAYEDVQAKTRALQQSTQLAADDRRQVEIGTLAPLDVVNADSQVATDKQALISSQSNLEYQQLLMKQAIARNLNDPQLANAPVVPTDRVGLNRLPEEDAKLEDLVSQAYANNPSVEQAVLSMQNNKITIRAEKNGLLPVVDAFGFYGASALGGAQNPLLNCGPLGGAPSPCTTVLFPSAGFGSELNNLVNNSAPDYGVGVNLTIPLRNRTAQADQVRSQMEYRQAEMRLQQIYTQLRIQLVNVLYALTNDRAAVAAAQASRDYNFQSFTDENKKLKLGASTTANVLQQGRNLATAEDNLNSALAAYARDRSTMSQILSNTLDRYGISLGDAVSGTMTKQPQVPGLVPPGQNGSGQPIDTGTGATGTGR